MSWSIDGVAWDIPCTVDRTSELTASDISGLMLDKSFFNDVLGTYMKYDLKIAVPFGYESQYNSIYEMLTDPVDGHDFVFPYDGGTIEVTGRVTDVKDSLVRMPNGRHRWRGTTFSVIANHPTKEYTLEEVLLRGAAPLPDESGVNVGSVYEYTAGGWDEIADANDNYY